MGHGAGNDDEYEDDDDGEYEDDDEHEEDDGDDDVDDDGDDEQDDGVINMTMAVTKKMTTKIAMTMASKTRVRR
eukprot:s5789_g1.t1